VRLGDFADRRKRFSDPRNVLVHRRRRRVVFRWVPLTGYNRDVPREVVGILDTAPPNASFRDNMGLRAAKPIS
jgi:hypothetical protein